jgi:hypothetical protein
VVVEIGQVGDVGDVGEIGEVGKVGEGLFVIASIKEPRWYCRLHG